MVAFSPVEHLVVYLICGNIILLCAVRPLAVLVGYMRQDTFYIYASLFALALALYSVSPVTIQSGWPENHEGYFWKYRMINYYQHFLQGDFFPLWSTGDCSTLGAPLPLFYQKLFYFVSATLFVFIGNVKTTIIVSLLVFEIIGIVGLFKSLRTIGIEKVVSLCLALSLLLMNYTVTDWLVRGNMAEFSALCLIPWLINWCLNFIKSERFTYTIIPVLTLLFLAHNIIAFYGSMLVLFAIIVVLKHNFSIQKIKEILVRGGISAVVFLAINAIYFVPMLLISDDYDVGKIKTGMQVENKFEPVLNYLFDRNYIWGKSVYHISVEFSYVFNAFFIFTLLAFIIDLAKEKAGLNGFFKGILGSFQSRTTLFIAASAFFLLYLQTPLSLWFYKLIPGADYIQFPWRLLTYIQVLYILIFALLLKHLNPKYGSARAISILFLLCMIFTYPFFKYIKEDTWPWKKQSDLDKIENLGVWGTGGEYIPVVANVESTDRDYYRILSHDGPVSSEERAISEVPSGNPENVIRYFTLKDGPAETIILPVNYSGLEELWLIQRGERKILSVYRTPDDPRIKADIPGGELSLELNLPTLKTSFSKLF